MIKVVIKGIKYVDDLPVDETQTEKLNEHLREGTTIGLIVQSTEDPGNTALIDLQVTSDNQRTLIKKGGRIGIEQKNDYYIIPREWEEYNLMEQNGKLVEEKPAIKNILKLTSLNNSAS